VLLAGLVTTAERAPVGVLISVAGLLIMIAAAVAVLFRRRRRD
jgi:LPXTG-motif cell wall-anchored protein